MTNSRKRTQEKAEGNKRRADAMRALAEGKCPRWNKDADGKAQTYKRANKRTNSVTDKRTARAAAQQKSPWDPSPAAAPRGSTAPARKANTAGTARAAPATATAAARAPSTARYRIPPSTDLQQKQFKRQKTMRHWMPQRRSEEDEREDK